MLVDKYHIIVRTWKWLQQCSENDIRKLPILKLGETLDNFDLSEDEKIFLGFIVQRGTTGLGKTVSSYAVDGIATQLNNVATQLHRIRHWEIMEASYEDLENEEATWFIDPPYQFGGTDTSATTNKLTFKILLNGVKIE